MASRPNALKKEQNKRKNGEEWKTHPQACWRILNLKCHRVLGGRVEAFVYGHIGMYLSSTKEIPWMKTWFLLQGLKMRALRIDLPRDKVCVG